jgi:hypothetical protein
VLRGLRPDPPTAIEPIPPRFVTDLTAPANLAGLRRGLRAALTTAGVSSAVIDDVLAAVTRNLHQRPDARPATGQCSGLDERGPVQCTVTDHGDSFDLPIAG